MKEQRKKKLQEAQDYLAPLSKEDFTLIFPGWEKLQAIHITSGLSVEDSWELFCEEWVRLGRPRVIECLHIG